MQISSAISGEEYGLSIDTGVPVSLWFDYRAFSDYPVPRTVDDFVIVTSEIRDEFF